MGLGYMEQGSDAPAAGTVRLTEKSPLVTNPGGYFQSEPGGTGSEGV